MTSSSEKTATFLRACRHAVELGNKIARSAQETDSWAVADGILAGAIQYWLYVRSPCDDLRCESCQPLRSSAGRLRELQDLVRVMATESEYFHRSTDLDVGHA